ncbi:MAG: hypothetical protein QF430_04065 [Candidatus Marinimicrobia bacterium]|nr:hypothetical protein [Candidatus Neomarinimicrobiota bacterium]
MWRKFIDSIFDSRGRIREEDSAEISPGYLIMLTEKTLPFEFNAAGLSLSDSIELMLFPPPAIAIDWG